MFEMTLPDPGEGLVEAEIVRWLVEPGQPVKVNDIVLEIETAKSIVELPSPFDGTVAELRVAEGDMVAVGAVVMTVAGADESLPTPGGTDPDARSSADTGAADPAQDAAGAAAAGASATGAGSSGAPSPESASPATGTSVRSGSPSATAGSGAGSGAEVVPGEPAVTGPVADDAQSLPEPTGEAAGGSGAILVGYGASPTSVSRRPRKGGTVAEPAPETDQMNESYSLDETPGHKVDEVYYTSPIDDEPSDPPLPRPEEGRAPSSELATDPVGRPLAKPAVRRLARDLGVALNQIAGTGPGGTITPTDVAQAAAGEHGGRKGPTRIPLRGVRRQMVQSMTDSLSIPQASVWMDVDVTHTVELIEQLRQRREFSQMRISPILVLAKAVCLAMARHPEVNSTLDLDRGEIVIRPDVNLGIAAATQRGLVVPNIKRANELNLVELAHALNDMVAKVREGRIKPSDAADGTFTITNVGVFGVEGGTPILNPGESAILLLGTFNRRPWVVGTGDDERVVVRSVAKLTLSIDHRVLDGEQASRFLADVATILEDPSLSMLF